MNTTLNLIALISIILYCLFQLFNVGWVTFFHVAAFPFVLAFFVFHFFCNYRVTHYPQNIRLLGEKISLASNVSLVLSSALCPDATDDGETTVFLGQFSNAPEELFYLAFSLLVLTTLLNCFLVVYPKLKKDVLS